MIQSREKKILNYISMAGTDINQKILSKKQAIEKVYFFCKEYKLKATRKTIKELIELEINCKFKAQKDYFFYNQKA